MTDSSVAVRPAGGKVARARAGNLCYRWYVPYLFMTPFLALFVVFWAGALLGAIGISFTNWRVGRDVRFSGVDNYVAVGMDPVFLQAMGNTLYMFVGYVVLMIPLALAIAVGLNQRWVRGRNVFQVIFFLPITMSLIVVAMIFDLLYNRQLGLLNGLLGLAGIAGPDWLGDSKVAPWSIIGLRVWRVVGYYAVILYAGLQAIPQELYEAAEIDGAGPTGRFWFVTLPLLKPVLLFVTVSASIAAWELFAEPWVLSQGGPARATFTAVMYIYRSAFINFELGRASAAASILALAIVVVTLLQLRFLRTAE
jgi:ABC-type sugar transport system permease subunit